MIHLRDAACMRRQRATPAEFGLRVRTHPDTLLITARNKMATGVNVVGEVRDISLAGRGIETARLFADQRRNEENFKILDRFLADLATRHGAPQRTGTAAQWHNIPADTIGQLLREYLVHPLNHDFQGDAIADFLTDAVRREDPLLSTWTVAVPTDGKMGPVDPPLRSGIAIEAKKRLVLVRQTPPQSLLVSGKGARVGSRTDVHNGLTPDQVQAVTDAERKRDPNLKEVPEDAFRAAMTAPLLVVYFLRGVERAGKKGTSETKYRQGLVLPALGLHFPGTRDPHAPRNYVSYRLNRVAQGELELDGDDLGDDDHDD